MSENQMQNANSPRGGDNSIDFKSSVVFQRTWNALNEKVIKNGIAEHRYKLICQEGSSRSTKTWSDFQCIFLYLYENPIESATILRDTQKSCRDIVEKDWKEWLSDPMVRKKQYEKGEITIQEFDNLIQKENLRKYFIENKTNHTWTFKHNGNFIRFTGLDDEDDAMGMTSSLFWLNEPYNWDHSVYKQLAQRSKVIIFDWNPKSDHWVNEEKLKDSTYVDYSTFLDNPFINPESRNQLFSYQPLSMCYLVENELLTEIDAYNYDTELNPLKFTNKQILELKRCLYNEKVKSANKYFWCVFGLGIKGEVEGKVFNNYEAVDKVSPKAKFYGYGFDYGYSKDPTAIVALYVEGKNIYLEQKIYSTDLQPEMLHKEMLRVGMLQSELIIGDRTAKLMIDELFDRGWGDIHPAEGNNSILYGIAKMRECNIYLIGKDLVYEFDNYKNKKNKQGKFIDKPEENQMEHLIDGSRMILTDYVTRNPFFAV